MKKKYQVLILSFGLYTTCIGLFAWAVLGLLESRMAVFALGLFLGQSLYYLKKFFDWVASHAVDTDTDTDTDTDIPPQADAMSYDSRGIYLMKDGDPLCKLPKDLLSRMIKFGLERGF